MSHLIDICHWGPSAWIFLHSITFNYPEFPTEQEKKNTESFFQSLVNVLPCKTCREHLAENYLKLPPAMENRRSLSQWLVNIHNQVNIATGKKPIPYLEVVKMYLPQDMYPSLHLTPGELEQLEQLEQIEQLEQKNNKNVGGKGNIIVIIVLAILVLVLAGWLLFLLFRKDKSAS